MGDYVSINRHRAFDLLEVRRKQANGQLLSDIRHQIKNMNRIAPVELVDSGKNTECVREWALW